MPPLLSVVTITYNHAPYIAKCIEGVLMQQVNFPMEFIIAEDCSTDGTRAICEEYAQKYPDLIRLITSETNVGANPNELRAMKAAKGKYIAYCEGDDYWTDPLKLQKQVDFLESHPDYSVCFHNRMVERNGKIEFKDEFASFCGNGQEGFDLTLPMFFHNWITFPFSMVFRRNVFDLDWYDKYKYFRDSHMILHFLLAGKGYVLNFVGGVRTIHDDSMFFSMNCNYAAKIDMLSLKELLRANEATEAAAILKYEYLNRVQVYIHRLAGSRQNLMEGVYLSFILFFRTFSVKRLLKNIRMLLFNRKNL